MVLGYSSLKDCGCTMFGASMKPFLIFGSVGLLNGLITKYMWDTPSDVYFLWFMLFMDFITGIIASYRKKEPITSKKLPRVLVNLFGYSLLLYISWNMANRSVLFNLLPSILYTGFLGVTFVSIFENLHNAGVKLSVEMMERIKQLFIKGKE